MCVLLVPVTEKECTQKCPAPPQTGVCSAAAGLCQRLHRVNQPTGTALVLFPLIPLLKNGQKVSIEFVYLLLGSLLHCMTSLK